MNRNQKIALGCGGAGCLGLIVVVIAGVVIWFLYQRTPTFTNYNVSTNSNENSDVDSDSNLNANTNSNSNDGSSTSGTSLSDDDRHKLYQAATMTGDSELLRRVSIRLGLMNDDFTPGDDYLTFVKDHVVWAIRNGDFIQSINTKEKAVAYVNEHFPE
jgi:hypothetical protein